MIEQQDRTESGRVRKRAPNACVRCRKQKIRCSGNAPCQQCSKRSLQCVFDTREDKIYVSQSYIAQLESRVANLPHQAGQLPVEPHNFDHRQSLDDNHVERKDSSPVPSDHEFDADEASETTDSRQNGLRATPDPGLRNPLDPSSSDSYTMNHANRHYFLGVSSNWSFGRRVLRMVHDRVTGSPLPTNSLLFEGSTYDLGWDGRRSSVKPEPSCVPTADHAMYLINAVKFHSGRLFHIFDETYFMHYFGKFYEDPGNEANYPHLWYIHFLLVLAFGKAFTRGTVAGKGKEPPGAYFFVQAMQLLPDTMYLYSDAIQSVEILCCAALYLQCVDLRSAAYNTVGQAMRMAVEQGMYTDMRSLNVPDHVLERCRETWWTVYVLDRQMTSLMGVPMSLSDDDITAPLPSFGNQPRKARALALHVKLAKAQAVIMQTVYGKPGGRSERFLRSMKNALRTIAEANEERNKAFALDLKKGSGICRLSAYLHLFHYQSLMLATRPLLYSFMQKRLDAPRALRVSSTHGARSLVRVCVGSANQCLDILEALHPQGLLECFLPFDREATFSSAVILLVAAAVDPSLLRNRDSRFDTALLLLQEMANHGNLIADYHRDELEQLDCYIQRFQASQASAANAEPASHSVSPSDLGSYQVDMPFIQPPEGPGQTQENLDNIETILSEWNSDDGLSGEHLLAVADTLDFSQLSWLGADFDQPIGMQF
ncbi:putative transcriptional regulatory protein [Pseudocercospora fuligena]|uniref:Putative transcriptional regulatory protein n=1 Tax=Pseudocercospora fuligena TaxID=685502 RepID=A0A8H6RV68_9PEZI|nr:putative transcriptional regulatory protein [Pseudocercospora fuligena]